MDPNNTRRFYLITHPRSASNLLVEILSLESQPNIQQRESSGKDGAGKGGYVFLPIAFAKSAMKVWGKPVDEWTDEARSHIRQSYQARFEDLEKHVTEAEADSKIVFAKDHVYHLTEPVALERFMSGKHTVKEAPWAVRIPQRYGLLQTRSPINYTILPDEYLKSWCPIFLIRHPALAFPSFYRATQDLAKMSTPEERNTHFANNLTFHWTRSLYDFYSHYFSSSISTSNAPDEVTWPILLDASDVIREPSVCIKLANIMGIDPEKLRFSWTPLSEDEIEGYNPISRRMLSTLLASGGVDKAKAVVDIDIDVEAKKWKEEFGESMGELIETRVKDAMPDYEFLSSKRLRPS